MGHFLSVKVKNMEVERNIKKIKKCSTFIRASEQCTYYMEVGKCSKSIRNVSCLSETSEKYAYQEDLEKRPESGSFVLIWVNFDLSSRITILCMTIIKFDKFLFGNAEQSYQTSNSLIRVRMLPIRSRSLLPFIHYTF